eukprot:COSAG05_NODE_2876_length_2552_cov_3.257236_1_plen_74_part_00
MAGRAACQSVMLRVDRDSPGPERAHKERKRNQDLWIFFIFMHARIISERDFQTIHLKIITLRYSKMDFLGVMI